MKNKKVLISVVSVFMALLMVFVNLSLPVGAASENLDADSTVQVPVTPEDKIDSALKEKMATASPDEKIPVAIWFEDIDKSKIEIATQEKCGISKADVYSNSKTAFTELTQVQQVLCNEEESSLQSYVDNRIGISSEQRRMRKVYNATFRSVAAELYVEHNERIVSANEISSEDIIFLSKLTPFMLAEIQKDEIERLSKNKNILTIGYYEDSVGTPPTIADMSAMNIDKSVEKFGLTGDGVKVLMVDHDFVRADFDNYLEISCSDNIRNIYNQVCYYTTNTTVLPTKATDHGNYVVARIQEVAEDVFVFSTTKGSYVDIEWAIENCDIDIINASANYGQTVYSYSYTSQWFDALISTYDIPLLASAGNSLLTSTTMAISPANGYNSVAVGAYNSSGGNMFNYRYNPINASDVVKYKPDIVVAAKDTSTAAPFATGIVAMMVELDPFVATNPALVKAILMASCHSKALPYSAEEVQENIYDGLTLKQGAGKVDAYKALSIVLMETYGIGTIPYGSQNVNSVSFINNNVVNVSLAWLRDNNLPEGGGSGNAGLYDVVLTPVHELTLTVTNNGNTVKSSNVTNSGKQMVYFPVLTGSQYDIHITKTSGNTVPVQYAYAWSLDFQRECSNVELNGKFGEKQRISVTAYCNDNTMISANMLNYQWQRSEDGISWLNISGAMSNEYILTAQDFLKYIRCRVTPKDTSGMLPCSIVGESELKVIVYGDSDLNGVVNAKDVTAVQKYLSDMIAFSDEQIRSSDVNGDGVLNSKDVTLIQKYISAAITMFPVEE